MKTQRPFLSKNDCPANEFRKLLAPYYATVGWTDVNLHRTYQTESNIGDVVAQSMLDAWPDGGKKMWGGK